MEFLCLVAPAAASWVDDHAARVVLLSLYLLLIKSIMYIVMPHVYIFIDLKMNLYAFRATLVC